MLEILRNSFHVLTALSTLLFLALIFQKRKLSRENMLIVYSFFIFNYFDLYSWFILKTNGSIPIVVETYDLLFPLFLICMVIFDKLKNTYILIVISVCIVAQCSVKYGYQISFPGGYRIGLSFIACLSLFYIVFKNLHRGLFQVILLLFLSSIPLFDVFYNAAFFGFIPFKMATWLIFLNTYIIYLSIFYCLFIYYYGKQVFKYPSTII
jgi:hypothetical protein